MIVFFCFVFRIGEEKRKAVTKGWIAFYFFDNFEINVIKEAEYKNNRGELIRVCKKKDNKERIIDKKKKGDIKNQWKKMNLKWLFSLCKLKQ